MPELPEVETVARLIRPQLVGRAFTGGSVHWPRTLATPTARRFGRAVKGAVVAQVARRGKYVLVETTSSQVLLVHLRMTGRLVVRTDEEERSPWSRVEIGLDDGRVLEFIDPRKFGRVHFTPEPELVLGDLGPEPLDPAFDARAFERAVRSRKRRLKPLLLDQTFLAGLGNIYVDEALFRSRLHPLRLAASLSPSQARALHAAIRAVLEEAIEREGSSFDVFYRTPEGRPGSYQDQFQVYGRHGKPCRRCSRPIQRLVVGQRGTHVCTRCQRAPRA